MRLTVLLMMVACFKVTAASYAQQVTFKGRQVTLEEVFSAVKQQTGYLFFYEGGSMREARPISVNVEKMPLEAFLKDVLRDQPLDYSIENKTIFIRKRVVIPFVTPQDPTVEVTGKLLTSNGEALIGASVGVRGGKALVVADLEGRFRLRAKVGDVLLVRFIGFDDKEVRVTRGGDLGNILVTQSTTKLDETVVQAYGFTSKRMNTGNIEKVSAKEIENTVVDNPVLALQGRVAGVIVTQTSGVPGAPIKVEIRGRTQLDGDIGADNEPLFIIDGVPMAVSNMGMSRLTSAAAPAGKYGLNPLSTMNMSDIESMEVLKDADATAIYGSRGANGVILITTKRGKAGATRINADVRSGFSKARVPEMLSTREYLDLRYEALRNDNKTIGAAGNYDLTQWDTTRDSRVAETLIGGTAEFTNASVSMSGGGQAVQYYIGGNYDRQTNVYPGKMPVTQAAAHFNINSSSRDGKFSAQLKGDYSSNVNNAPSTDLTSKINLPPNFQLYDSAGNMAWNEKGINNGDNPLAYLLQQYSAKTDNINGNLMLNYRVTPEFVLRTSLGYNGIFLDELAITPKTSQNPKPNDGRPVTGASRFSTNVFKSWIVEPQAEYTKNIRQHRINVLVGGTLQSQRNDGYNISVTGYTSDDFLGSLTGIVGSNINSLGSTMTQYKYGAFFARANYNYNSKYIVNLSARRDGSSRFGPNYRFSNFGAVGGAWLFTSENFMKDLPKVSYGKLRASYGVTGNDRIGDYKYLDAYTANVFAPTYRDSSALVPSSLFKPDLHWERNKKFEVALELGFLRDRILVNVVRYHNRASDPLVNYPLPSMTGFTTVAANLNGVLIDNKGWEFSFTTANFKKKNFDWTTNFNITLPKNELVRFPDLAKSSYATKYIIGRPLNLVMAAKFLGIDPQNGLYALMDRDKNGTFGFPGDLAPIGDTDPDFYGGMTNTFRYKGFTLDVLLQFNKQLGRNWATSLATSGFTPLPVGGPQNIVKGLGEPWRQPGDQVLMQKYTTITPASNSLYGNYNMQYSDYVYADASFLRVKNVSLGYTLPAEWLKVIKLSNLRLYAQAQNLATFSSLKGGDPESIFLTRLPPLRTVVFGIQVGI
ncbi:SusC/RagA family TonB-linked outer membrane protein [Chitinophaga horti]|uniref:SusC/RagA family TonB-linked outer membrane protein n=1 Tax=Chitinophaga horti TaxID=2920382 RepID=A0ABY6J4K4_9BACT|nr:SusC/RagA family TonB-linked outer membrane protein [Chitinophaga horti]UYQ94528.1 SusC/RagA family TonB-linked outer membrane protein [Chitinophaga horti]